MHSLSIFLLMVTLAILNSATIASTDIKTKSIANEMSKNIAQKTNEKISLELLVPDKTEGVLYIKNVPQFYQSWKNSPMAKIWENKKIRKRFAETIRTLEQPRWELYSQRIFGLSSNQLIELFSGQLLIFLPEVYQQESLSLLADIGKNQKQVKTALSNQLNYQLKQLGEGEQYLQEDEEYLSSTIHSRYFLNEESKTEHFSWTIVDQYLLISRSKSQLENMLANIQEKSLANNWTETTAFQNINNAQPESDWIIYMDASPLMNLFNSELQPYQAMIGEDSQQFMELINNTGLESLYVLGKNQSDKTLIDMSIFYQDNSWLMSLFKHQNSDLKWPVYLQKNALSASTSSINLGQLWKNVLSLPDKSSLFAHIIPMIQMQLQSYSKSSGVNLENALTDGFGQQLYMAQYPIAKQASEDKDQNIEEYSEAQLSNSLYVISLQDQQTVEMAINGLQKAFLMSELFEKKQFLETNIYFYNPSEQENIHQATDLMVYSISDDLLFYSNNLAVMENAIEQLRQNKSGTALSSAPQVQAVMEQLPEDAVDVSYYQGDHFAQNLVNLLELTQNMLIKSQQKYSCGSASNSYIQEESLPKTDLSAFQGYFKSVLTTQHQAQNYYRLHTHINH